MKKQIKPEHKQLIESVIRESEKFRGNEELIDIFCDAVYKKTYLLLDAMKDIPRLKRHLHVICDGCMDSVIREKQKFTNTKFYKQVEHSSRLPENIISVKKDTRLYEPEEIEREYTSGKNNAKIVNLKEEIQRSERYSSTDMLIDPLDFCPQKRISEHTIEKLINIIKEISQKFPNKKYYEIFKLRYIKKMNQADIARELKVSQVELSKRFVEMIKLTRESL